MLLPLFLLEQTTGTAATAPTTATSTIAEIAVSTITNASGTGTSVIELGEPLFE